jgi:hypothetical protein
VARLLKLSRDGAAKIAALMSIDSDRGHPETNAPDGVITQSEAAEKMGVSVRSVRRARRRSRSTVNVFRASCMAERFSTVATVTKRAKD